ncbi:DUF3795 domain-containing protein [Thermodesulfobacteriota bacterium]
MSMIGLCGDNCQFCPRYIAAQNGSIEEYVKVKELWIRLGLRSLGFPVEDMACHGCKPENKCAYKELRECVIKKGCKNCGLCDEYPCELIMSTFKKSEKLRSKAAKVCNKEEMNMLQKAFFLKKEYFDQICQKQRRKAFKYSKV